MPAKPVRKLTPLGLAQVVFLDDGFLGRRIRTNRDVTLPIAYRRCKETGRIDAFRMGWKPPMPNPPHKFWDSDVAKWVEAAAYDLATHPESERRKQLDAVVNLIASAQQSDGYLNVHYTIVEPEKRWTNVRDNHELYCAGHLMEAAVAHYRTTGSRKMLDVLGRYADHIASVFGRGEGQKRGYGGHPEIELALVKMYRATGERKYLDLAKYLVDERGQQPHFYDAEAAARGEDPRADSPQCWQSLQAHKPVRKQDEVVGHAVRAMYLHSGMADVAMETGDAGLMAACRKLWDNVATRKMYVTGGVGSHNTGEAMGANYELPNETAYAETCASIGLVFFARRMLEAHADAKYADVIELALYNGILSGVSLSGDKFFYSNPLAVNGRYKPEGRRHQDVRQEWFNVCCCPTNVIRLLASLGEYVYSTADNALYVHLYASGTATTELAGRTVSLKQQTGYPWDGQIALTVGADRPGAFSLMLRIPAWCRRYKLTVNGKVFAAPVVRGYARITRKWSDGDQVRLVLDMPVERVVANPAVPDNVGKVALQRGPIVYCLEQCDHAAPVPSISLPDKAKLTARRVRLLGGCVVIEGAATAVSPADWKGDLYRPSREVQTKKIRIRAVPYSLWANRKPGAMTVWLPRQ
jgi:DUF1680 family protein